MKAGYRCTGSGFRSKSVQVQVQVQVRLQLRVRSGGLRPGDDPLPTLG
jgi:hypothetical protein